jgi:hypothetical protein
MKETYVVPSPKGWAIQGTVSDKTIYPTQNAAVSAARKSIKAKGGGQLIVHSRSGKVRDVVRIGPSGESRVVKDPAMTGRLTRSQVRDAVWNATKAARSFR